MNGYFHRRVWVLLASAAAAFAVWNYLPGTAIDRSTFTAVSRSFTNPPLFISGAGSQQAPWTLRALSMTAKADAKQAPVIVTLGDDPQGFFQNSPPAPIDLAVIFSNFYRLGVRKAASAAVLAWDAPDPIGLAALEHSLAQFDSLVMAAPLARGAVSMPIPPAFRRASIPLAAVVGDATALPQVNRLPIPDVILGGETTLAGFSVLESQPHTRLVPLLAVWENRLIFSFSLLSVLQRLNLKPEGVEVRLGETLKLSPVGPSVAIDGFGQMIVPLKPLAAYTEISAETLIDGGDSLFPKNAPESVILRNDQTAADPTSRDFSRMLSATIAAIASEQGMATARAFPRLMPHFEIAILAGVAIVLTLLCGAASFLRHLCSGLMVTACLLAQWLAFANSSIWLPGLAILAAIAAMEIIASLVSGKNSPPEPVLAAVPTLPTLPVETPPSPAETFKESRKRSAKKKSALPKLPKKS